MQTSYSTTTTKGFPGMKADSGVDDVITRANTEESATIPFGVIVAEDASNDEGALLPAASTDKLAGLVQHSSAVGELDLGADRNSLNPTAPMNVARKGRYWVTCESNWVKGAGAFVRYAGTGQKGAIRAAAVTDETIDASANIKFMDTGTGPGLAQVEIDFAP